MRVVPAAVFLLVACGVETPGPRPATVEQQIVGGNVDTNARYGSVFVLKLVRNNGPTAGCTATLITPRTLLTAAHCLQDGVTNVFSTNISPAPASSPTFVESTDWRRHPMWTAADPASWDIGVVLLPSASALKTIPYARSDLSTLTGQPLTAVGYGVTGPSATDNGTRRWVDLTFRAVTAAHIAVGNTVDKGICFGDSGGPSLHLFGDAVTRVVGLHSYTQPSSSCTDGLDTRVDLYGDFIRTWLMDKEGGGTCVEDGLCKPGCAPADPDCVCVADGVCSAACVNVLSDPDCPADCAMNGVCTDKTCGNPDPDCTAELAPCTTATQCASRKCVMDVQRGEQYCARGCTAPSDCAAGTVCVSGACLKPQKPQVAPGGTCVATTDFCLGGTSCLAVPNSGLRCTKSCSTTANCPAPTTCSGSFCLGNDVVAAGPGERCDPATTYCTGNTVCAGLAQLGPPTCAQPCNDDPDCPMGKICQQGVGGVRYCEFDFVTLPLLDQVSAPAAKGCSTTGGPAWAALLLLTTAFFRATGARRRTSCRARR